MASLAKLQLLSLTNVITLRHGKQFSLLIHILTKNKNVAQLQKNILIKILTSASLCVARESRRFQRSTAVREKTLGTFLIYLLK
jgi:hypothetical protein